VTLSETIPLTRSDSWTVEAAVAAVAADLTGVQRLGVAFSGGVDSAVLLALATQALGRSGLWRYWAFHPVLRLRSGARHMILLARLA
jgi:tRNA(Ile)-lysidine synthase TilS/MesJ